MAAGLSCDEVGTAQLVFLISHQFLVSIFLICIQVADIKSPSFSLLIILHVSLINKRYKVQGVRQNCTHFCFLNFSASLVSRNSILDIFQLPFPCGVQKCPLFYYLVKSRLRYLQITTRWSFQKLTFLFFC